MTDRSFSIRLQDLFDHRPDVRAAEIELLKVGRHFRLTSRSKLVVGRNERENCIIRELSQPEDVLLDTVSVPGPTCSLSGDVEPVALETAHAIASAYSDAGTGDTVQLQVCRRGETRIQTVTAADKKDFRVYLL